MAVARANPIAPGVYWLDVFRPFGSSTVEDQAIHFTAWLGASGGAVKVLKRETREIIPGGGEGGNRDRLRIWYLFEVLGKPAPFPFDKLGFPTVQKLAKDGIKPSDRDRTSDDTVQKPEPGGLFAGFPSIDPTIAFLIIAAIVLGGSKNR
jgi:hypothetical protein